MMRTHMRSWRESAALEGTPAGPLGDASSSDEPLFRGVTGGGHGTSTEESPSFGKLI